MFHFGSLKHFDILKMLEVDLICHLLEYYIGCSESSCNCVISLIIFIRCTGKLLCVNFHLF